MNVKQIIVVNNELRSKLRHGKLAAQVSHASLGAVFSKAEVDEFVNHSSSDQTIYRWKCIPMSSELEYWFNEQFTKVVLRADNEEHLLAIHKQAEEAGLLTALIKDVGNTVFHEPTYTCVGIGPATDDQLDPITGDLKMY